MTARDVCEMNRLGAGPGPGHDLCRAIRQGQAQWMPDPADRQLPQIITRTRAHHTVNAHRPASRHTQGEWERRHQRPAHPQPARASRHHCRRTVARAVMALLLTMTVGGCSVIPPAARPSPSLPAAAAYLQAIRRDPHAQVTGIDDATLLRSGRAACQLATSFNPDQAGYAALLLTIESSPHLNRTAYERTLAWASHYLCPDQANFVASTLKTMHRPSR